MGMGLALAFGAICLTAFAPLKGRSPWLLLVLIAGGPVFAPAIALLIIFVFMATWATDPLAREKARGTLESLLATLLTALHPSQPLRTASTCSIRWITGRP